MSSPLRPLFVCALLCAGCGSDPTGTASATDKDGDGAPTSEDCNDADANIRPGATEVCNGIDDNCNGAVDEGHPLVTWYQDQDDDRYGLDDSTALQACAKPPGAFVDVAGDCNDASAAARPGATEVCDGLDNDCDGQLDEGFSPRLYFKDQDGDGYGVDGPENLTACDLPAGYATAPGDCNDAVAAAYPEAIEICDEIDDNCDGVVDEGFSKSFYYADHDGDGFGSDSAQLCEKPAGYSDQPGDCDDLLEGVYPGATEICNLVDDDCNGVADDGLATQTYFADSDGDGYGVAEAQACTQPPGFAAVGGDCDDGDPAIHPGAIERCNQKDDDCDWTADEEAVALFFLDEDWDGYGVDGKSSTDCPPPPFYSAERGGDCDDTQERVSPGTVEFCDARDNDCDGEIDEGLPLITWYEDKDGDKWGNQNVTGQFCDSKAWPRPGWSQTPGDPNDDAGDVYPRTWWPDSDSDGFGDSKVAGVDDPNPRPGFVTNDQDCDDSNPAVKWALEYGIDSDGDGCYADSFQTLCTDPGEGWIVMEGYGGFLGVPWDCADDNADRCSSKVEVCGNGIDDNCDGAEDEGVAKDVWYSDTDKDGHGDAKNTSLVCPGSPQPTGFVATKTDCNDADDTIHPGAADDAVDGVDSNCDGYDFDASGGPYVLLDAGGGDDTRNGRSLSTAVKTLPRAAAIANGVSPALAILARTGSYDLAATLDLKGSLHGGYDATWQATGGPNDTRLVQVGTTYFSPIVRINDVSSAVTLSRLSILAYVAWPPPANTPKGAPMVSLLSYKAPALTLKNVFVKAGNASDGQDGAWGGATNDPGAAGGDTAACSGNWADSGDPGASSFQDWFEGWSRGGAGAQQFCASYCPQSGNSGDPGTNGREGAAALSGPGSCNVAGQPAATLGAISAAGAWAGCVGPEGIAGKPGGGGGGGGQGSSLAYDGQCAGCTSCPVGRACGAGVTLKGGVGGTGGAPGKAGLGGKGGQQGGGSFGIVAADTHLVLENVSIERGNGGKGGNGGAGGSGGAYTEGALGSIGEKCCLWTFASGCIQTQAGSGGKGGNGGVGGPASGGSAGHGGPSVAIATKGTTAVEQTNVTFTGGYGGSGGTAGTGGYWHQGGSAPSGQGAVGGAVKDVQAY